MPSVLYHTKTNNPEIKRLLDDPFYGKELIMKLTTNDIKEKDVKTKTGETKKVYFVVLGTGDKEIEVKVRELVYSNK